MATPCGSYEDVRDKLDFARAWIADNEGCDRYELSDMLIAFASESEAVREQEEGPNRIDV